MNDIIKTMMEQIHWPEMSRMIGVKGKPVYSNEHNSFSFQFSMFREANHCRIRYVPGEDLYCMEFYRLRRLNCELVQEFPGLYADQLNSTFQTFTGLDTRMPRVFRR